MEMLEKAKQKIKSWWKKFLNWFLSGLDK